jgi:hypothetical protein
MLLKKWVKALGTMVIVTAAPATFASSPVKLNCPAGTVQKGGSDAKHDIAACVKQGDGFKPHGPTVYFYPSGAKEAEGQSENGFRTGLWTFYSEKGTKTGTAMFKGSNFHGEVVDLYPDGKVRKVELRGTFKDTPTGECLTTAVKNTEFPAFKAENMNINYPFILR